MNKEDTNMYFESLEDIVNYLDDPSILDETDRIDLVFASKTDANQLKSYLERNMGMKTLNFPNGGFQYFIS